MPLPAHLPWCPRGSEGVDVSQDDLIGVFVQDYPFAPAQVVIAVGDSICWQNLHGVCHNAQRNDERTVGTWDIVCRAKPSICSGCNSHAARGPTCKLSGRMIMPRYHFVGRRLAITTVLCLSLTATLA
jgi:hypothetical protein